MAPAGTVLDARIARLASTTFCGQRLRRSQIADIQEIVRSLPQLSRTELGHTVCVYLRWQTPAGRNRIQRALRLLEALEGLSILTLPARQSPGRGRQKPLDLGQRSAPQAPLEGPLAELEPLRLRLVSERHEAPCGTNSSPATIPSAIASRSAATCATACKTARVACWAACCRTSPPAICPCATAGSAGRTSPTDRSSGWCAKPASCCFPGCA